MHAISLYTLNCQISESFYISLQMLEVALRNRIHDVASTMSIGDEKLLWFDRPEFQLVHRQASQIEKARSMLNEGRKPDTPAHVVAALTFGYWTSFLGRAYEGLWQKGLHRIAQRADGRGLTRKAFSSPLMPLRMLRNRIAHHEPILYWDLPKHHARVVELTGWLSPAAANWTKKNCRFSSVYPTDGIQLVIGKQNE